MKLLLSEVQGLADDTDNCDVLKAALCHVKSAVSIMKALKKTSHWDQKKRVAPNTNHEVQSRFTSTKKKEPPRHSPAWLSQPVQKWRTVGLI